MKQVVACWVGISNTLCDFLCLRSESRLVAQVCRAESLAGGLERANREGREVTSVGSSGGCSGSSSLVMPCCKQKDYAN